MKKLISALLLSTIAFSAHAADQKRYADIGAWEMDQFTGDDKPSCVASASYRSGDTIGFVFTQDGIGIYIGEVEFKRAYDVVFTMNNGRAFRLDGHPDGNGGMLALFPNLSKEFIDAIGKARSVDIEGFGTNYELTNSKKMIETGFLCMLDALGKQAPISGQRTGKTAL